MLLQIADDVFVANMVFYQFRKFCYDVFFMRLDVFKGVRPAYAGVFALAQAVVGEKFYGGDIQ